MSDKEQNIQGTASSEPKKEEDINSFLDSLTGSSEPGSADDFLNQLYGDSFKDLTTDFDTLLKEFQSINPDDPMKEEQPTAEPTASVPETASVQEMEDIYSYSDMAQEAEQTNKKFSKAVEEAMDAEVSGAEMPQTDGAFSLSLDKLDGDNSGFGQAVEDAAMADATVATATRVYSTDAVRNAAAHSEQPERRQPEKQQPVQRKKVEEKPAKKKKRSTWIPQKNDSPLEVFRKVLFLVSMVVVVVCLVIIGNTYLLQPQLEKMRQGKVEDLLSETVSDAASFQAAYGNTSLPEGANYNLAQFYAANSDFYGYLEVPGTGISTPVVQGKDNNKYLRHNFFGEYTKYGCPFVNYKNTYAALDYNTTIFGHNMEYDDLVFGELESYRTIDGFKKAPLFHLETLYADYYFKVYAAFLTDSTYDEDGWYFDYIFTQLKDEAECKEYIAELDARKLYSTGVDILPSDKLLTLSTCAYDFNEERLVVVGRLVRDGEDKTVDTSKAKANNNPRYPAKYYQKKGITNPFATASKWIPNA